MIFSYRLMFLLSSIAIYGVCFGNFSFVQISDIHCGFKKADTLSYLSTVVGSINGMIEENDIKFALVTGDISHNGNITEMKLAKSVLDKLKIPYLPTLGNHDVYSPTDEDYEPTGDYLFSQVFSSLLAESDLVSDYVGTVEVKNPSIKTPSYFQNYVVNYDGLRILVFDYNARNPHMFPHIYPKKASPGVSLWDFEGGTWRWMKNRLMDDDIPDSVKSIVFGLHHPFYNPIWIPKPYKFGWSDDDKKKFEDFYSILDPSVKNRVYGDISGHLHRWEDKTPLKIGNFQEHVCNAVIHGTFFLLVNVRDGKIEELKRYGERKV